MEPDVLGSDVSKKLEEHRRMLAETKGLEEVVGQEAKESKQNGSGN